MDTRTWFALASAGFGAVVDGIDEGLLGAPGLGEWDVRALLGHATRSYLTVEQYLSATTAGAAPELHSASEYYAATSVGHGDPEAITRRGREAGEALGARPVAAALEIAVRVSGLVDRTPDDAVVATPFGVMALGDYLATRAFELTVHGVDLARATGQDVPDELLACASPALRPVAELAEPEQELGALLALTGREPLPTPSSVL